MQIQKAEDFRFLRVRQKATKLAPKFWFLSGRIVTEISNSFVLPLSLSLLNPKKMNGFDFVKKFWIDQEETWQPNQSN